MKVVVAGGGVAGLEAMLALGALARGRVEVTLLSPTEEFVYRPMLVAEPFGVAGVLRTCLEDVLAETGGGHVKDSLAAVDPARRRVGTAGGAELDYDALLVAFGARPVEAVPGALTFGKEAERRRFAEVLRALGRRETKRLAFVVPRATSWSIAAYELALLTAAERDARRLYGVELSLITHEKGPLDVFGASVSRLVASRLEQAGVSLRASAVAESVAGGRVRLAGGEELPADSVVALPALEVPRVPGLPQRDRGFVQTDTAMQVAGLEHVWAAGDATWFPIKQGGLAAQQADVAARAIAVRAGADVPLEPWRPVLRAALITGGAPEFLRASRSAGDAELSEGAPLWSPPQKIAGRFLGPYLARVATGSSEPELVDLAGPAEPGAETARHDRAVSLLLSAADADAGLGDFEGAMKWLALVEELNLVLPPDYVARRLEWRRHLDPAASDQAAERIDPSFASAAAALSDLQRRVGWLREIEARTGGEMSRRLAHLDEGMDHLIGLSRETGVLARPPVRRDAERRPRRR